MPSILIVDDEPGVRSALGGVLRDEGYNVDAVDSGEACLERLAPQAYDVVVLDIWLPGMDGLATLTRHARAAGRRAGRHHLRSRQRRVGGARHQDGGLRFRREAAVARKDGAGRSRNALRQRHLEAENLALRARVDAQHTMVGESYAMVQLREQVAMAAPTNGRVLIYGENGTGKELVARNIHAMSRRRAAPFVEVNCAAIPEELIESELFGHVRGAFTGARRRSRGKFESRTAARCFSTRSATCRLKNAGQISCACCRTR